MPACSLRYDNAVKHRLGRGMLCYNALRRAQIKEDGMRTEALIELTAMTQQLTKQVISKVYSWDAIIHLIELRFANACMATGSRIDFTKESR